MLRVKMLGSFRGLLRAQATAFKGDDVMQSNARLEIRSHFLQNSVVNDTEQLQALIGAADEAADFLVTGVVQATLDEQTGGYGKFLASGWTGFYFTDTKLPYPSQCTDAKVEKRHMKDGKTNVELHGIPKGIHK
jgi:hypothetical protein